MPAGSIPNRIDRKKLIVLAVVLLVYSLAFSYLLSVQGQVLARSDHFSRWYPTQKLFTEGRSLYDPRNRLEVNALNEIRIDPLSSSFFYPAHLILLTAPLVVFAYPLAHFIWVFLIQVFYIAGIWLIWRENGWPETVNRFTVFLLMAVFFIPNVQNTIWGQFNTVAVLSLASTYLALKHGRDGLAGFFALGLTFKPQALVLTIAFLTLWALVNRRWKFLLAFGLACLISWFFAEWFEPNWVVKFLIGLQEYVAHHKPVGILDVLGPLKIPLIVLILIACCFYFYLRRDSQPGSPAFDGLLVVSFFVWWFVVPVLGMMHLVVLPLAVALVLPHLHKSYPGYYRTALYGLVIFYLFGIAGFVYGLSRPELYGLHIRLADRAYKDLLPIWALIIAYPLIHSSDSGGR